MHCTDDKANGIILNHNGDWSGKVRIAWYVASERGPASLSLRECWCESADLVAGRFTPVSRPPGEPAQAHADPSSSEPPVNVLTRAVALAVEGYLRSKIESALDDLFIRRGKLWPSR